MTDRNTAWPWSWEEEAVWKAELEERDYDFIEELIDNAVADGASSSDYVLGPPYEEEGTLERYSVTA
ncbi:MAG: hypothetical protein ABSD75_28095 [Terriglobales bacterium]